MPYMATPTRYLTAPQRDLDAWTRYFREAPIPVLAKTSEVLETLRADEDNVDANRLGGVIECDPLMSLKLLAHVASKRRADNATETESITTSLVMTGISPFFRSFVSSKRTPLSIPLSHAAAISVPSVEPYSQTPL